MTIAGTTAIQQCNDVVEGNATRQCSSSGNWLAVDSSGCVVVGTCTPEVTETGSGTYVWPRTAVGEMAYQPCQLEGGNATRQCVATDTWLGVDDLTCLTFISLQYNELEEMLVSSLFKSV